VEDASGGIGFTPPTFEEKPALPARLGSCPQGVETVGADMRAAAKSAAKRAGVTVRVSARM
jgi:hypothetical protein